VSVGPDIGEDAEDAERRETERQTASMKAQLSKDVAAWSKERREPPADRAAESPRPALERTSPQPAASPKKRNAVPSPAKPAGTRAKPFRMSYDGVTQAEYIQYMLDRGSR
jgi:hypothetical protein